MTETIPEADNGGVLYRKVLLKKHRKTAVSGSLF